MCYTLKLKMSPEAMEEIAHKLLQSNMDLTKMRELYTKKDSAFIKVLPFKKRFHSSLYSDMSYDKEYVIAEEFVTKKLKLTNKQVTIAAFNTVQLKLSDNKNLIINPKYSVQHKRFCEIKNHLDSCAIPDCICCLMQKITDNKDASFLTLNHVVRCTNPHCENVNCFLIKNIIKYNSFQEDFKLDKNSI